MNIIAPQKRIGVGVSGGMDSMALTHLLLKLKREIIVINIDHGIRGEESHRDSKFVVDFCKEKNIQCLSYKIDVLGESQKTKESVELCARRLRYQIFERVLKEGRAEVIALAHHASDNAETVFMRILRGTGIRGLRGILDSDKYIHPLIDYTRADIEKYAAENSIKYVEDSSNKDNLFTRNFIRNQVFPVLRKRFDNLEKSFYRLIDTSKEIDDFINQNLLPIKQTGNLLYFDAEEFENSHKVIQKYSVLKLFEELGIFKDIEKKHLEYIVGLSHKKSNAALDLPSGIIAIKEYDKILFMKKQNRDFEDTRFSLQAKYVFYDEKYSFEKDDKIVKGRSFDAQKIPKNAVIRQRKDGDIFQRCNGRTKKLNDFLTDIKMPKRCRDKLLVVASGKNVLMICGEEISDKIKIDQNTKQIYTVKKETI